MSYKLYILALASAIIIFAGCRKDVFDSDAIERDYFIEDIPEGFSWATTSQVSVQVIPSDKYNGTYLYTIEIFDKNPLTDKNAKLLGSGWCTGQKPLQKEITLLDSQETLFIRQITPGGRKSLIEVAIENNQASGSFAPITQTTLKNNISLSRSKEIIPESIPSNAVEIKKEGDITLSKNTDYVISETYKGKITFPAEGDCSLYIKGTWINTNKEWEPTIVQNNTNIYIMEGGKLVTEGNKCKIQCSNNTIIAIANDGQLGNTNENNISIQLQTNGTLLNDGELYCDEITSASPKTLIVNKGKFHAQKVTSQGIAYTFDNQCYANVKELRLDNNSELNIASYCSFTCENLTISANSTINMYDLSLLQAKTIKVEEKTCHIKGKGKEFALITMDELTCQWTEKPSIIFAQNLYVGCKKFPDPNFYQMNAVYEDTESGATIEIKPSECSQGNDYQPEQPEQPEFPKQVTLKQSYTFASEDNYPSPGDYDMNDLVVSIDSITYNYMEKDMIDRMIYHVSLRAVGASRQLGAAIQLDDIKASDIKSITYSKELPQDNFKTKANGIEKDQKYAVIPLFDNAHKALGVATPTIINTVSNDPKWINDVPINSFDITIEFTSLVEDAATSINKINYFAIVGTKTPRTEIHLPKYAHTDLSSAPTILQDVTKDLMWTIQIPGIFRYPHEWISILEAYTDFKTWVQSGGSDKKEWYSNPTEEKLYQKK